MPQAIEAPPSIEIGRAPLPSLGMTTVRPGLAGWRVAGGKGRADRAALRAPDSICSSR